MTRLGTGMNYKIVPENSTYIIGSNSKNSAGDLYAVDINFNIANSIQQRNKQLLDIVYSLFLLVLSPLLLIFIKNRLGFFKNIILVLARKKTWVGYVPSSKNSDLPKLLDPVLTPIDTLKTKPTKEQTLHRINLFYAKDYTSSADFSIIIKAWRNLGRQEVPIYVKN